jgi:hypothetical protein
VGTAGGRRGHRRAYGGPVEAEGRQGGQLGWEAAPRTRPPGCQHAHRSPPRGPGGEATGAARSPQRAPGVGGGGAPPAGAGCAGVPGGTVGLAGGGRRRRSPPRGAPRPPGWGPFMRRARGMCGPAAAVAGASERTARVARVGASQRTARVARVGIREDGAGGQGGSLAEDGAGGQGGSLAEDGAGGQGGSLAEDGVADAGTWGGGPVRRRRGPRREGLMAGGWAAVEEGGRGVGGVNSAAVRLRRGAGRIHCS